MGEKLQVLILCTANSARSQMAEGLMRSLAHDRVAAYSAGAKPTRVNPYAIAAMRERGIDITCQSSEHLSLYLDRQFDYVITVCDNAAETCPAFPGPARRIHWSFPDPAAIAGDRDDILQAFIRVRNGLEDRISSWLAALS